MSGVCVCVFSCVMLGVMCFFSRGIKYVMHFLFCVFVCLCDVRASHESCCVFCVLHFCVGLQCFHSCTFVVCDICAL